MRAHSTKILGTLVVAQSLFVANTFLTWVPVGLALGLAILMVTIMRRRRPGQARSPRPQPRWLRWALGFGFHVVLFAAIFPWRMPSQFNERTNVIYAVADVLAHFCICASILIWVWRPRRGHLALLPHGIFAIMLSVAAGGISQSMTAQASVGLMTCLGYALASHVILGTRMTEQSMPTPSVKKHRWLGPALAGVTLSVLLMGTSALASLTGYVLPVVQMRLHEQLRDTLNPVAEDMFISGMRYVEGSEFGDVREHMMGEPDGIALRVRCNFTPGYLRGHAFDVYRRRRWFSAGSIDAMGFETLPQLRRMVDREVFATRTVNVNAGRFRQLNEFELMPSTSEKLAEIAVRNDPQKGFTIFLPLETRVVRARSRGITVTPDNIVRQGIDVRGAPYIADVSLRPTKVSLSDDHRAVLLDIPRPITRVVETIKSEAMGDARTPRDKMSAVETFFQSKFSYSLKRVDRPRGIDPIVHFLETRHPAHCELFAASSLFLLRSAGVPARYVTGYVADEFSEEEDRWFARNRDAHAWVEAYDDQTRTWVPVESTPGRLYESLRDDALATNDSSLFNMFGSDSGDETETWYSRAWDWITATRVTNIVMGAFRVLQIPLFLFLVYYLWTRYLRPRADSSDPLDQQSLRMLRNVDKILLVSLSSDRQARRCTNLLTGSSSPRSRAIASPAASILPSSPNGIDSTPMPVTKGSCPSRSRNSRQPVIKAAHTPFPGGPARKAAGELLC